MKKIVKAARASAGCLAERIHYVKGKMESIFPAALPAGIALLRLDTNLSGSASHELIQPDLLLTRHGARQGGEGCLDRSAEPVLPHRVGYPVRLVGEN